MWTGAWRFLVGSQCYTALGSDLSSVTCGPVAGFSCVLHLYPDEPHAQRGLVSPSGFLVGSDPWPPAFQQLTVSCLELHWWVPTM